MSEWPNVGASRLALHTNSWPDLSLYLLHCFFFLLRSFLTSPPWICTGVTYVGTIMWKSEMDTGERHPSKVIING